MLSRKKKKPDPNVDAEQLETSLTRGKTLSRILVRSKDWQERAEQFRLYAGASLERGPELNNVVSCIAANVSALLAEHATLAQVPLEAKLACLQEMALEVGKLEKLQAVLAPHATDRTATKILKYAEDFWSSLDRRSTAELSVL
eukprot:5337316-Lingulodinium_polyedra.AAC.1